MERPAWQNADGSVNFADLDDFDAKPQPAAKPMAPEQQSNLANYGATGSTSALKRFPCRACRGSGKFVSWSGRVVGDCFKCRGEGYTKTDPAVLALRREKQANKKRDEAARQHANGQAFLDSRADVAAWFEANAHTEFAQSLKHALFRYGALTPNQLAAVERSIVRDRERAEARERANAAAAADPNALDLTKLPSGMYAVPEGETRLKLRVSRPKQGSKWHGFIFVDDGAAYGSRRKYGSQKPGGRYVGQVVEQLRTIMANPMAAAAAYGHLTGSCGVCGRHLEDAESVARGIGPVCAGKF